MYRRTPDSDTLGNELLSLFGDVKRAYSTRAHTPKSPGLYFTLGEIVSAYQIEAEHVTTLSEQTLSEIGRRSLDTYFAEHVAASAQGAVMAATNNLRDFLASIKGTKLRVDYADQALELALVRRFHDTERTVLKENSVIGIVNASSMESSPPALRLGLTGLQGMLDRSAFYSIPIVGAEGEPTAVVTAL